MTPSTSLESEPAHNAHRFPATFRPTNTIVTYPYVGEETTSQAMNGQNSVTSGSLEFFGVVDGQSYWPLAMYVFCCEYSTRI